MIGQFRCLFILSVLSVISFGVRGFQEQDGHCHVEKNLNLILKEDLVLDLSFILMRQRI